MVSEHPELIELSQAMRDWAEQQSGGAFTLMDLAVQYPLRDPDIACSIYGCNTPEHVTGIVESALKPLPPSTFEHFEEAFEARIAAIPPSRHFYWFKKQQPGNREWAEMAVYPRGNFFAADGPTDSGL